jgi:hypothetical protein
MKKYQDGGKTGAQLKKEGAAMKAKGMAMKAAGTAKKVKGAAMAKANVDKMVNRMSTASSGVKLGGGYGNTDKVYKTGGMVNSNTKVSKQTVPGSKGVKSGVNPKTAAQKVAKGRVGGTSSAPKKATPGK